MAKKRNIFDRYKTYEGERGSTAQWQAQAKAMVANQGKDLTDSLNVLGLSTMPTLEELQKARRKLMVTAHPDKGGSQEKAVAINEAFSHVSRLLAARAPLNLAPHPPAAPASGDLILVHPPRCTWELPEILENPDYIADLKVDGERLTLYLNGNPYTKTNSTTMLTRYVGKHTKQYGDRSSAHPAIVKHYENLDGTVLDTELYQGMLYAFDIPFYKGQDLRQLPLRKRREILRQCLKEMGNSQVVEIPSWTSNFMEQFHRVVESGMGGGEGLIIKDLNAAYGVNWAKLKKSYDVSCVVMFLNETEKGQGSFTVGVYESGKLVEVGRCNGGNESFVGRVVDVFAQELTVHSKLRHGTFHRFRDDVNPQDCTLSKLKDDMKKAARANRIRASK